MVSLDDILDARTRLTGVVRPTPAEESAPLSHMAGRPVILKPEHHQRTGSFKIRGAWNLISRLPAGTPVVAASAGNHAQGVALAASMAGLRATIFMPANAALPKVAATEGYGATVHLGGEAIDEAIAAGQAFAAENDAVFVPPFDDPLVIAGQGTIGLELAEEAPGVEVVVVPVGGGGLISGIAAALAGLAGVAGVATAGGGRRPRVVGVEAAGAACLRASLDAGWPVRLDHVSTMADGIAVRAPSDLTFDHARALVDDVVTVGEEAISRALLLLLERAKTVVEPAGAVGLAAVLGGQVPGTGPVAVVLSGGNIDPLVLMNVIDHGLSAAGRYLVVRVVLDDRPGELGRLAGAVAGLGLNIGSVEHHRSGTGLPFDQVEVVLTLETRDPGHRDGVVESLAGAGYRVARLR